MGRGKVKRKGHGERGRRKGDGKGGGEVRSFKTCEAGPVQ